MPAIGKGRQDTLAGGGSARRVAVGNSFQSGRGPPPAGHFRSASASLP